MNHLVIMAKQPVAGRVKSRLAVDIGVARATGFYRNLMAATTRNLSQDNRWKTWVAVAPDRAVYDFPWNGSANIFGQGTGNLGERMQRIFDSVPTGPVVIIGTDIPFITANDIAKAFKQLGSHDMVFGDAGDGGYWLVGARRSPRTPKPFVNVRWSGKHALTDTLANVEGLKIGWTTRRFDVDTKQDYLQWQHYKLN